MATRNKWALLAKRFVASSCSDWIHAGKYYKIMFLSLKAKFYPLIIDPNNNIMEWLKSKLPVNATEFTSFENPKLYSSLELAVRWARY